METLNYRFDQGRPAPARPPQLVGVAGSGNLEVLVEPAGGPCEIAVATTAAGFGAVWEAVLRDFHARWDMTGLRIAINDVGATPAVVSLRLDQAVRTYLGEPA
jgi:malonate decarboxylase delta subunit